MKAVSRNLVGLDSMVNLMFLGWEFIFANNTSFVAFFFFWLYCHGRKDSKMFDLKELQSFSILFKECL